ncbi:MAG: DUF2007 domain-containing protein [Nitrospiraceae bacterium]
MALVKLIVPFNEGELALIKSLLDASGIPYFVHNEHFGSLYPGMALPFNARIVMVDESDRSRAETLLGELTRSEEGEDEAG